MNPRDSEQPRFDFVAGSLCLDFVNTVGGLRGREATELLRSYGDLLSWAVRSGAVRQDDADRLAGRAARRTDQALKAVHRAIGLRESVYSVFVAVAEGRRPSSPDLATLNAELAAALSHASLTPGRHGFDWTWTTGGDELDRPLWPVARSAAELLTSNRLARVRQCAGETCGWLFLDTSKNGSRQWCDMKVCGNRAKVRRHRARRRSRNA